MNLVPLPQGAGWHFVNVNAIAAIKYTAPKKATVILTDGTLLECTEDTHVIHKRIEDHHKLMEQESKPKDPKPKAAPVQK